MSLQHRLVHNSEICPGIRLIIHWSLLATCSLGHWSLPTCSLGHLCIALTGQISHLPKATLGKPDRQPDWQPTHSLKC